MTQGPTFYEIGERRSYGETRMNCAGILGDARVIPAQQATRAERTVDKAHQAGRLDI